MMSRKLSLTLRYGGVLIGVFGIVLAGFLMHRLVSFGIFHRGDAWQDSGCTTLPGISGPEDAAVDPGSGFAYVSSVDRRAVWKGDDTVTGSIFRVDLNEPASTVLNVTPDYPVDFRPLGLCVYRDKTGHARLFVINERAHGTGTVEIFEIDEERETLRHAATVHGDLLVSPNNIVAVGADRFYVTNDGRSKQNLHRAIDVVFRRGTGNVIYYDGAAWHTVARGLRFPNGIAYHMRNEQVYVAETVTGYLRVFDIDHATGGLAQAARHELGIGLDNLHFDEDGRIWVARHPNLIALNRHRRSASSRSPSEVWAVSIRNDGADVEVVFHDDGQRFSGATVAAPWRGRFLIGTIADHRMLLCEESSR